MTDQMFESTSGLDSRAHQNAFAESKLTLDNFSEHRPSNDRFNLAATSSLPELKLVGNESKDATFTLASDQSAKQTQEEKHTMSSRVFSWGWTFDIKDANGKSEGTVDQKMLHLRKTFAYQDENGKTLATGAERLFSWGTKIDISDQNGKPIGGLQEEVFKSFWHPYTVYSIVDEKGNKVATSEKVDFGATDFTLKNNNGEKIATIHRPWLNWVRDNWSIDIIKPNEVDKRILYMIPAYKSSADADRKAKEEEEEAEKERKNKQDNDD